MSDSHGMPANPSTNFVARLKLFLADKLFPLLSQTIYKDLKSTQDSLDRSAADVHRLQQVVDEYGGVIQTLTESIQGLRQSIQSLNETNERLEKTKFQLTSRLIAEYQRNRVTNPPSLQPQKTLSAEQIRDNLETLLKQETLPLDVLAVIAAVPETYDNIYRNALRPIYEQYIIGEVQNFWDIRMALNALSRMVQPRHYLEIGTRLGWSLAQVLAYSPSAQVYSFDMWVEGYGGVENPGSDFVYKMMSRITEPASPQITFISGNSHDTLPQFFSPEGHTPSFKLASPKPIEFDLITVDGDHNLEGAWMDLIATFPHIAVGGAIVFDDLELSLTNSDIEVHSETQYPDYYPPMPSGLSSLRDVWNAVKAKYPNFVYIESTNKSIAVGIGIRLS